MPILRAAILLFGAVCCIIALIHIAIGPSSIPGSVPVNATMDSEDRFYATLFLGFGIALLWSAKDLAARSGVFHFLLAIFFLGGVSRTVSAIQVGPPNLFFQILWAIELVLPPVMYFWLKAVSPLHPHTQSEEN